MGGSLEKAEGYRPLTAQLREKLDERGIEWRDLSESYDGKFYNGFERTKFKINGIECSVVYGCTMFADGSCYWGTYGAPGTLECWYEPIDPEPVPVSVEQIVEMVDRSVKSPKTLF